MASGMLGISLTGLHAAQAGIRTTQHNIANVNTEGYRRQEVAFAASKAQYTSAGYVGTGTRIDAVRQLYSQFLDNEVLLNEARLARHETYAGQASQVDKMLGDAGSGLSTALDNYFSAVNEVANDPTSNAARQNLLSAGRNLAGRIGTLDDKLKAMRAATNQDIDTIAERMNVLSAQIANLNNIIGRDESLNGRSANDLRDQRHQLVAELNKLANVSTIEQSDGTLNVYIGSGQPLVVGTLSYAMTSVVDPNDSTQRLPALTLGTSTIPLDSSLITGGQLGGVLAVREQILSPALNELDRLAFGIADQINTQHLAGFDLNGVAGTDFFTSTATLLQQPTAFSGTTGTATLALTNSGQLQASGYLLEYDGVNYTLTRLSDGASSTGAIGAVTTIGGQAQGFTLAVAGAVAGDRWVVHPIKDAAGQMEMQLGSPSLIAASATIAGSPGDNANALAMAALRLSGGFNGVSYHATYDTLITRTASLSAEADLSRSAFSTLVEQATASQKEVSGVNLDEEAVNLIRFQQAYQAAARAMQIAASLFDEVLGIVR